MGPLIMLKLPFMIALDIEFVCCKNNDIKIKVWTIEGEVEGAYFRVYLRVAI